MERKKPAAISESQLGINFIHVCICTLQSGNGRGRVFYGKQIYVEIAGRSHPTRLAPPLSVCLRHFCFHYFFAAFSLDFCRLKTDLISLTLHKQSIDELEHCRGKKWTLNDVIFPPLIIEQMHVKCFSHNLRRHILSVWPPGLWGGHSSTMCRSFEVVRYMKTAKHSWFAKETSFVLLQPAFMLLVSYEQDGDLICDDERGVAWGSSTSP